MIGFRNPMTVGVALAVLAGQAVGTVWDVPTLEHPGIQSAINDPQVVDGDTISVWGYGEPPFTYYENVDYLGPDRGHNTN